MISCWISAVPLEDVVGWWRLAADRVARSRSVFESPNRVIAESNRILISSTESWGGFKHGYGNAAIRRYATERVAGLKKGCKQFVFFIARE